MAVIAKVLSKLVKNLKAKTIIKAVGKYTGRQILRRSGIFGIYGTVKKIKKFGDIDLKAMSKITKSVVSKNMLRALGPANYFRDWYKKGAKYMLKQIVWQHITPMEIKKLWYLHQNYKSLYNVKTIEKLEKKELWNELGSSSISELQKIEIIESISKTRMENDEQTKWKWELLDNWFVFNVSSTSGNFNQYTHKWNPAKKIYHHPIRSGSKKYTRLYTKTYNVNNKVIKDMIKASSYGKQIYWPHFRRK